MLNLPFTESGERLLSLLKERPVFLDGAMGTLIQREKLPESEFRKGLPELENNPNQLFGNTLT